MNDEPRLPDDAPKSESLSEAEAKLAEMDRRIEEQKAASQAEIDKIHAGFDEKLTQLDKRLQAARKNDEQRQEKTTSSSVGGETGRSMGIGLTVAYGIMGGPIAGWLIGMAIDRQMGTGGMWQGWLVMLGAVMGIVFAVVTLQRQQK
jgi:F0F1-type ATP synthase assembly protein I